MSPFLDEKLDETIKRNMEGSDKHVMKMNILHQIDPPKNPKLEKLRTDLIESYKYEDMTVIADVLGNQLAKIHAAYLFHPKGWKALKSICTMISSITNSWRDLAGELDLNVLQIGCIDNYKNEDFTYNVLQAYALKKDATLGWLIQSFERIGRLDTISASVDHLITLGLEAIKENPVKNVEDEDILITPRKEILDDIRNGTFITLKDDDDKFDVIERPNYHDILLAKHVNEIFPKIHESVQQAVPTKKNQKSDQPTQKNVKKYCKKVMLTFAEDGKHIAKSLVAEFSKKRENRHPIFVLILDDYSDRVISNPEAFIMKYFNKMDYIVPIVTEKYIEKIKQGNEEKGLISSLDSQYIYFIYNLMIKDYVRNNCMNKRVRCVIPDVNYKKILNSSVMKETPVFECSWVYESEIDDLAKRFLKIYD